MVVTAVPVRVEARGAHLNKTKITMTEGDSVKLKVSGVSGKIKWSTSKKSVATVSQKGVIKAKNEGTTIIKAKIRGKTLKCKVIVKSEEYDDWDDETSKESELKELTPLESVKSYIKTHGSVNLNGDPILSVEYGDYRYTVLYNTDKDRLEFVFFMMGDIGDIATISAANVELPPDMIGKANISHNLTTEYGSIETSGYFNVGNYRDEKDITVSVENKTDDMASLSDLEIAEMSQSTIDSMIAVCNTLISEYTDYTLHDIGFDSYK